jgi:hypothetical protein
MDKKIVSLFAMLASALMLVSPALALVYVFDESPAYAWDATSGWAEAGDSYYSKEAYASTGYIHVIADGNAEAMGKVSTDGYELDFDANYVQIEVAAEDLSDYLPENYGTRVARWEAKVLLHGTGYVGTDYLNFDDDDTSPSFYIATTQQLYADDVISVQIGLYVETNVFLVFWYEHADIAATVTDIFVYTENY